MAEIVLRDLGDDGYHTPTIKLHSLDKIHLHNYYASIFATAMRGKWAQLAYLGLYSGAGRARIEDTGEIVETTALGALRVAHPFTKYIFVDHDPLCIEALHGRVEALSGEYDVELIQADVAQAVPDILGAMPRFTRGRGLLSFCFIDPFSAALDFNVIRELASRYRMDFLILLMLGQDVRMNFRQYSEDPADERIGRLIDHTEWREEWRRRGLRRKDLIPFVLERFDAAMTRLGYQEARREESHPIRIAGKRVFLYSLLLYSKDPLAKKFWKAARFGVDPQFGLPL